MPQRIAALAPNSSQTGFSLIELLIAMAVVAILTAIALPMYTTQIRESRRPEAKTALLDLASREERYFTLNNTYVVAAPSSLGYNNTAAWPVGLFGSGTTPDYQLSVTAQSASGYTLQAVPVNQQANDTCGTYQLDNFGNQYNIYPVGGAAATITGCW